LTWASPVRQDVEHVDDVANRNRFPGENALSTQLKHLAEFPDDHYVYRSVMPFEASVDPHLK